MLGAFDEHGGVEETFGESVLKNKVEEVLLVVSLSRLVHVWFCVI